jgi:hypothetical protein
MLTLHDRGRILVPAIVAAFGMILLVAFGCGVLVGCRHLKERSTAGTVDDASSSQDDEEMGEPEESKSSYVTTPQKRTQYPTQERKVLSPSREGKEISSDADSSTTHDDEESINTGFWSYSNVGKSYTYTKSVDSSMVADFANVDDFDESLCSSTPKLLRNPSAFGVAVDSPMEGFGDVDEFHFGIFGSPTLYPQGTWDT